MGKSQERKTIGLKVTTPPLPSLNLFETSPVRPPPPEAVHRWLLITSDAAP